MTRYYSDSYNNDMDRCRNWAPQLTHYYDERTNPLQFSYAEGRSMRSAPAGRPDRIFHDIPDQDQPANSSTRRRIAVAVRYSRTKFSSPHQFKSIADLLYSVRAAVNGRSNAVEMWAMVWDVKIAGALE